MGLFLYLRSNELHFILFTMILPPDCDNQTILTVHLSNPLTYRMTKGKMVQIIFDPKHDILDAAKRVFGSKRLLVTPSMTDEL